MTRVPGLLASLLLLLFVLPACDSGTDEPEEDLRILFGVSFERLFSDPSAAEIQAVRDEWAARNPAASGASIVASGAYDGATVYVVSHTMTEGPGAPFTHYGVVRVPDGAGDDAPVLVVHHGGDSGVSISSQSPFSSGNASLEAMTDLYPMLMASTVQVPPTYRSEPLFAGVAGLDAQYVSGGEPSPWDYDVDDSMALLSAALDLFDDETDEDRIAAIGYSRGANVALLHQIRDDRIDAVTEYYGPSDFYNSTADQLAIGLLLEDEGALGLPGGEFLFNEVLDPLRGANNQYDEDADYASARREVIRRSASLFKGDLANLQIHHHTSDPVVPYAFSQAFDARAGTVGGDYEFNTWNNTLPNEGAAHSPEGIPDSNPQTEGWLLRALGLGQTLTASAAPALAQ